jgi:uncharacterized protein YhfF
MGPVSDLSPAVQSFWDEFTAATGVDADFEAWPFGDGNMPELADELAELVLHGPKRATTGLYEEYLEDGEMPRVGGYGVVLDGRGEPVCIIRTTRVDVVPFGEVDEDFAWDEGEGDRSLADWRRGHEWYFNEAGTPVTEETLVVLERFELVWPVAAT